MEIDTQAAEKPLELAWPSPAFLPAYADALRRGWWPDNERKAAAAADELREIGADPERFLQSMVDLQGQGAPITLPDGSVVKRLPGFRQWLWDGEFCGQVGFRWQAGTEALPPYCLGHIGYSVVPWKQRRGYATRALALLLPQARAQGLRYVELTTDPDNRPSQRVIELNGGTLLERFNKSAAYGGKPALRYRIDLSDKASPP